MLYLICLIKSLPTFYFVNHLEILFTNAFKFPYTGHWTMPSVTPLWRHLFKANPEENRGDFSVSNHHLGEVGGQRA
jgi:hypothetical protein